MSIKNNILELLEKSYNLYKNNFSDFIQFAIVQLLINIISIYGLKLIGEELIILYLPIGLILFYIQMRLLATFVLLAMDRYQNIYSNIPTYYNKSKPKIWQYIGASLMFAFISGIVFGLFSAALLFSKYLALNALIVLIGSVVVLYFSTHYFLAPLIILLDPESKVAFTESFNLIKPVRITAMFVVLVTVLLPTITSLFFKFLALPKLTSSIIETCLDAILAPLSLGVIIIFYYNLITNKVDPQEDKGA